MRTRRGRRGPALADDGRALRVPGGPYEMPDRIRILLVDDHAMVRRGMRDFLALHDDLEVVGEAEDGAEAPRRRPRTWPRTS